MKRIEKTKITLREMMFFSLLFFLMSMANVTVAQPPLRANYNTPATNWENQALPIGNGYMGAMIFGGVESEVIQINEHSVWSGGPGANASYNGGHSGTPEQNKKNLQEARQKLQMKMIEFSQTKFAHFDNTGKIIANDYSAEDAALKRNIEGLMGDKSNFGSYQTLGNLHFAHPSAIAPSVIGIVESNCESSNPNQGLNMIFDGNWDSKWYADEGFKGLPCYFVWEYDQPFLITSYSIVSGGDMPQRDPKSWNLYASENGTDFTLINSQKNIIFNARKEKKTFSVPNTEKYKYFKFEMTEMNTPTGYVPQISEIILETGNIQSSTYSNYQRTLNIDDAVVEVNYTDNGIKYDREYFMSYPKNVMLVKLSADQKGKLTRTFWISSPQLKKTISAENGIITMTGYPSDHTVNGLKFAQQIKIIPVNGTMTSQGERIVVENADEILIIMSASTNYVQCMDNSFNYFSSTDPLLTVKKNITDASTLTYEQLLEEHKQDYHSLYEKMAVSLGSVENVPTKTTTKLLSDYGTSNTESENLYLEMLYYQFGRYLLISSSRENTLPANLQGVWADGLQPPWASDYHTNINLQMNYWLAEQTNLSTCHVSLINYINSLVPRGKQTAQSYYCKEDGSPVRGWVDHHENNIWGNTAPGNWYEGFYFPTAAAWLCQHIWEHYLFTQNEVFLAENFNTMLEAALFWVDNLWRDRRDGTLVSNPSYSPEHGSYSLGASCDQAIVWELFDFVIKSGEILGNTSKELEEVKFAKKRLAAPQIGLSGQFMEWKDEITRDITGDGGHRHVNHLHWLHPGSQVISGRSAQDDLYIQAMEKTLNTRGDGGTGWSMAWKINFWARLHDGNRSHKMVKEILKNSTLSNLFDNCPPFQIDGNFGATAGMTEMLVQSQGDCIEIFPALPDSWNKGSFKGIRARGNFEITANWENSKLTALEIISNTGKDCVLKQEGIKNCKITQQSAGNIPFTILDDNKISFETVSGGVYVITIL